MDRTALVVGVTGIAGYNTAQALLAEGWRVVGLSRSRRYEIPGVEHVYGDVLDVDSVEAAIAGHGVTHLFFTTWSRQDTEAENCRVNGAMLANALEAVRRTTKLQHAVLVTGLSTTSARSRRTPPLPPRRRSGRARSACRSRTSTTSRRTSCSPPRRSRASRGRSTGRTR